MSGDWSPDQPLRADATDEQMRERIDAIGDEMLLVPAPADWRNDEAVRHAWNIALLAAIDGIRNGVIGEEMKAALDNLCVRVASCGRDEAAPWHEDEALNESIGMLVDDRHFFGTLSRGAAWSVVLDICTKAVSASCGRGTEGEGTGDAERWRWLKAFIGKDGDIELCRQNDAPGSPFVFAINYPPINSYGSPDSRNRVFRGQTFDEALDTFRAEVDAARSPEKPHE